MKYLRLLSYGSIKTMLLILWQLIRGKNINFADFVVTEEDRKLQQELENQIQEAEKKIGPEITRAVVIAATIFVLFFHGLLIYFVLYLLWNLIRWGINF